MKTETALFTASIISFVIAVICIYFERKERKKVITEMQKTSSEAKRLECEFFMHESNLRIMLQIMICIVFLVITVVEFWRG